MVGQVNTGKTNRAGRPGKPLTEILGTGPAREVTPAVGRRKPGRLAQLIGKPGAAGETRHATPGGAATRTGRSQRMGREVPANQAVPEGPIGRPEVDFPLADSLTYYEPKAGKGGQTQYRKRKGGLNAKESSRLLMNLAASNAVQANTPMWDSIAWLRGQANEERFSPEGRAAFLAPRLETLEDAQDQALAEAQRDAAARGLDASSYGGAVEGTVRARGAEARSRLVGDLYSAEEERQAQAQALLRDFLSALQGRDTRQAADIAEAVRSLRLKEREIEAREDGSWLDALVGIGGTAANLWRASRK